VDGDDEGLSMRHLMLVENEVSQAVNDQAISVSFNSLDYMGVMTQYDIRTLVNELSAEFHLFRGRMIEMLGSPVQRDDQEIECGPILVDISQYLGFIVHV